MEVGTRIGTQATGVSVRVTAMSNGTVEFVEESFIGIARGQLPEIGNVQSMSLEEFKLVFLGAPSTNGDGT
jgi:hypothetical protein